MRVIYLLAAVLTLSACTTTRELPNELTRDEISAFELQGKVALMTPQKRQSGNLAWQGDAQSQLIQVNTPIGTSVFSLSVEPGNAELQANGERHQASNTDELLQQMQAPPFPVEAFAQWLLSREDNLMVSKRNDDYLVTEAYFEYAGELWRLRYSNYQAVQGVLLASDIEAASNLYKVKLKIHDWKLYRD